MPQDITDWKREYMIFKVEIHCAYHIHKDPLFFKQGRENESN
jgi:hypothetical protein